MLKNKAKLRTFQALIITLLMVLSVLLTTIFSIYNLNVFALTNATIGSAYRPGATVENPTPDLYKNGTFNDDVLKDIREKIFGNAAVTQTEMQNYIKENGKEEFETYNTGSYVVKAPTINKAVGNETNGMVVRINGIDWMVVSMTLADIGDKTDNVILTLYQADDYKNGTNEETSAFYSDTTNEVGRNMYASSILRRTITEGSNYEGNIAQETTDRFPKYDLFRDKGEGSFAQKYLVQPKYITYQGKETITGRGETSMTSGYMMPNESYNVDTSDKWHANVSGYKVAGGVEFAGAYGAGNEQLYGAWQNDYIWIPSATETGFNNYYSAGANSIWKLTDAQRAHTQNYSWLRSGSYNGYDGADVVAAAGTFNNNFVSDTNGVRPAIHFNLSAVDDIITDPVDVETTYNGKEQTLQDIAAVKAPDWYEAKYHGDASKVVLKYYKESDLNNDVPAPKEAGTYWVQAKINDTWLAQNNNLPQFGIVKDSSAGTAPSGKPESLTERWFKITIKKKDLNITLNLNQSLNGGGGVPPFLKERLA